MPGDRNAIGLLLDAVTQYMAEVGITERDHTVIQEVAQDIVRLVTRMTRPHEPIDGQLEETGLPKAWLTPEEDALIPPRQLWQDPQQPISHYCRWLWEYLAYLPLLCGLRRESAVLELGCSHGRTALGLLHYLRHPGSYRGLDVDRVQIEEAQKRIQHLNPALQFLWADVYNRHCNPQGRLSAASYVFPFDADSFDVVYAASLFTHLLPEETKNYFHESCRVLKPGGRCLFSFCLLDYYRGPGTTLNPLLAFEHPWPGHPGVAVRDLEYPEALMGYSLECVTEYAQGAGLRVLQVIPGLWSESPGLAVNELDLVLLGRDDSSASTCSEQESLVRYGMPSPVPKMDIATKHKAALEHEKTFWVDIATQDKFHSMRENWRNNATHFEAIVQKYLVLHQTSKILQIGPAVQDAINFWSIGQRMAIDPLAHFYAQNFNVDYAGILYITGIGEHLPFVDGSIDVILCLNVLDHTMNPEQVISECRRALREGGIFFLGIDVYPKELLEKGKGDPIHFWRFTSTDIMQLLAKNSFLVKEETLCEGSEFDGASWFWVIAIKESVETV